ncbi:unnamed protein product [Brassica napus]|uniref:(rape) hypothetical protein n=1 Tax=Brassica napus TaxID=3708 RepID=A0A816IFC8_BRANA|nr:unnamed protein product [Brassica napus]
MWQNFFSEMYPQRNHNYKVWSKGRERQQEDSLGAACNDIDRLIAGISSVIEVKPKKEDGKEKSGAGVKEASWIDLYLPEEARGYAKLARLDINPLELGCLLGLTCALVLRGAACTINDLFDRDIDRKVERTRLRPLASGLLTPFQGIQFLGLQLLLLLGILLQLNNYSRVLGALSLLLNFSYPLMTRFTHWPQTFLGFTINWGALLGWAAVKESLEPAVSLSSLMDHCL